MSIDQDESSQVIRIVYLAKLAEQAERYDGELHGLWNRPVCTFDCVLYDFTHV